MVKTFSGFAGDDGDLLAAFKSITWQVPERVKAARKITARQEAQARANLKKATLHHLQKATLRLGDAAGVVSEAKLFPTRKQREAMYEALGQADRHLELVLLATRPEVASGAGRFRQMISAYRHEISKMMHDLQGTKLKLPANWRRQKPKMQSSIGAIMRRSWALRKYVEG